MAKLKKNIDKGIAYLKRNGVRAAAVRLCRKARLSRAIDYEKWLKARRKERAKLLSTVNADHIKIVVSGRMPEQISTEDYFLFIEEGDELEQDTCQAYACALREHPGAELFYCDSDELAADRKHYEKPSCKPDFDEYYLQSTDYIGGGFLVSGRLAGELGAPGLLYDYLWRCIERTGGAVHVPEILYHRARQPGSAEENTAAVQEKGQAVSRETRQETGRETRQAVSRKADRETQQAVSRETGRESQKRIAGEERQEAEALRAHFVRTGVSADISRGIMPGTRKITYTYEGEKAPLVSVLIPNRDHREDLEKCIGSIRRFAGYEPYEILVIENNSVSDEIRSFYEEVRGQGENVRIVPFKGDFNFSRINNFGAKEARGEYLLFLNNDTEMISEGCIMELMNYARRPDVGIVGAQMYYGDDTVQHAGVIVGYGGVAGHAFEGMARQQAARTVPIACARAYSAVTAACMMVRRSVFEELGGFDEELGVAYNDIDLCLRAGRSGKKVLYTPYAQLYHYESRTRGLELTKEKAERVRRETEIFQDRWAAFLRRGDPCYNPNLTLEKSDFSLRIKDDNVKN